MPDTAQLADWESMEADYTEDGKKLLEAIRPASLLCIGFRCDTLARCSFAPPHTVSLSADTALHKLRELGQFEFAFVANTLEQLPKEAGSRLLARLRDMHGGRFAVAVRLDNGNSANKGWRDEELLAMGLVRARRDDYALYLFDIHTYKHTPDWLNPRYWAHPERWDKDWW